MIIERFRNGNPDHVGARFKERGRMIPDDSSAEYVASWMTEDGSACFQIMSAPTRASLDSWIANWSDLVEFEVTPIKTSAEFWNARGQR